MQHFTNNGKEYLKNKNMSENSKPVTMEEIQSLHDEWWNSLSEDEKIKLFQEQKEAEDYFYNQKQSNRDLK